MSAWALEGERNMKPYWKIIGITFLTTTLFWILIFVGIFNWTSSGPPPFQAQLDYPETVSLNQEFEIFLHVRNPGDEPLELASVDIYHSFLKGFSVITVFPSESERMSNIDFDTFWFEKQLKPKEKTSIMFKLEAVKTGYFWGDLDICTPTEKFTTIATTIEVTDSVTNENR